MKFLAALFIMTGISLPAFCLAEKPLVITTDSGKISYSSEDLLNHPERVTLKNIQLSVYKGKVFDVQAIPLCSLLQTVTNPNGKLLKISTFDNYISYIALERIYPCQTIRSAIAYIAIEDPNKPWPVISKLNHSAGEFYLIWQGQAVQQTDWVFGTTAINLTTKNPFSSFLPLIKTKLEAKGLEQFSRKCGNCHSINLVGNLEKGPDLNVPMNPLEYFSEQQLRRYIRNPQSMRIMKNDLMFPFTKAILSDQELNAIIAFLQIMRTHKITLN